MPRKTEWSHVPTLEELETQLTELEERRSYIRGQDRLRPLNSRLRYLREKIAEMHGNHTAEEWADLVSEFDGQCTKCGVEGVVKSYVVPICMGGSKSIENVQPLCKSCASKKGEDTTNWVEIRRNERAEAH